ncbi:hypothetical protein QTP70_025200 [Hemibagrus guttatus]|uniref:Coiled-coil domain-containing protein 39 n=1 Tax=Hemibagrus guttatus TaxID=175788 RepID=A0AAE0V790_9TELE|nr:hypothetical protein QTP70_025200 [Hemibagrus guttatus]KAK3567902.1 hypothetical protein QTP86_027300 [Hemibagrus guttatus]
MQQYIIALEAKLRAVTEEALSVEERAAQMDQLLRDHEKHLKDIDTQLQREHKLLFQKMQELKTLRAKEKNVIADISGSRVALSSLDNRLSKLDQNALRQQDYINNQARHPDYNKYSYLSFKQSCSLLMIPDLDFQIQLLEGKMARLSGNVNEEERHVLEKQVSELSVALEEKKKAADFLAAQLKNLQNDIRCVGKENEKTGADKRDLTTKIEELNLVDDTLNKELKRFCLKKQDSIVENNIQQLEVKRLRTMLYDRADGVLSLEKRKLQLQIAMKERQKEICVHQEMHSKQLKITEQEMQGLRAQLHERLSKVDKMKKKYEIVIISMAAPEGEEHQSQAYYIIKAAQEKEELQCKGDDLDAKICIAEKENKALENTLHLLNNHNSTYRKSFNKVTESSPEYQEKLKLEEQKRAADEKGKFKKRQIRELQENVEVMSSSLNSLQQEVAAQRQKNADLEAQIVPFKAELISQQEKRDRATKQSFKLTKEVRSSKNTTEETFEERDLNQKVLKDCKKAVNKLLLEVIEQHPDLREMLQTYFVKAGLALPSPASTPSSRSSKLSSARSSVSLRSSRFSGPSAGNSARGSAVHSPSVKTVELGLGLAVSSTLLPQSLGSDSSRSSNSNRSSRSIRSGHLKIETSSTITTTTTPPTTTTTTTENTTTTTSPPTSTTTTPNTTHNISSTTSTTYSPYTPYTPSSTPSTVYPFRIGVRALVRSSVVLDKNQANAILQQYLSLLSDYNIRDIRGNVTSIKRV